MSLTGKNKKNAVIIRHDHIFRQDEYFCSACRQKLAKNAGICPNCGRKLKGTKRKADWITELEIADILDD